MSGGYCKGAPNGGNARLLLVRLPRRRAKDTWTAAQRGVVRVRLSRARQARTSRGGAARGWQRVAAAPLRRSVCGRRCRPGQGQAVGASLRVDDRLGTQHTAPAVRRERGVPRCVTQRTGVRQRMHPARRACEVPVGAAAATGCWRVVDSPASWPGGAGGKGRQPQQQQQRRRQPRQTPRRGGAASPPRRHSGRPPRL
eukprot:365488-Chlamydomonas_euryale.AAC.5